MGVRHLLLLAAILISVSATLTEQEMTDYENSVLKSIDDGDEHLELYQQFYKNTTEELSKGLRIYFCKSCKGKIFFENYKVKEDSDNYYFKNYEKNMIIRHKYPKEGKRNIDCIY